MKVDCEKCIELADKKLQKIIDLAFSYMECVSDKYIEEKIRKAYEYAKDAHK